ncbi:MAG: hypothetical protein KGI07_04725 [Thaumarchaeota archaeon]|nr:hypothetical protein [Nitrososphaerota archaeon]
MDDNQCKILQRIVKEETLPKAFRGSVHSIVNLCLKYEDIDLLHKVYKITCGFAVILQHINAIKKKENNHSSNIEFSLETFLQKGQHVVLIAQNIDDVKQITLKITEGHKEGALLFAISPNYQSWFQGEYSRINKNSISYFVPPIDRTMITADRKFDKEKAKRIVMDQIGLAVKRLSKVDGKHPFVKAVTLASSEYLVILSDLDWESFFDYEDDGRVVIEGKPMSWLCLYNFGDLMYFQEIENILTIITRCVRSHHAMILHGRDGNFYEGTDALVRCYELILWQLLGSIVCKEKMLGNFDIADPLPALMTDLRRNLNSWEKVETHYEIQSRAIDIVKIAHDEILGISDRIWPKIDEKVHTRLKSHRGMTVLVIVPHETTYIRKMGKMGAKFIVDENLEFIPIGILVVDKRHAGIVLSSDASTLDWNTAYFTDKTQEAIKVRKIFEYAWNKHPLRINSYDFPEFERLARY